MRAEGVGPRAGGDYVGPGLLATLHLAASTPGVPWVEVPARELETPLLGEPPRVVDGHLTVPVGPGLGVAVNEEALRCHRDPGTTVRPFAIAPR